MTGGKKTGSGKTLTDTVGQTAPGQYDSNGYIVKAGFQYIYPFEPFSFSISDLDIAFGSLVPETPSIEETTLKVSAPSVGGYSVTTYETGPLESTTGATIPDTTCDADDCDEQTAGVWQQSNTYGFGFNLQGDDVAADFTDDTYFRQFADQPDGETPQEIMGADSPAIDRTATASFKVNISGIQTAGDYQTSVVFICTPEY